MPSNASAFALPDRLAAKRSPELIGPDESHFARIAASVARDIAALGERLDAERLAPAGEGQAALDRDAEIRRLSARLRTLRRFGLDVCLGRMVLADAAEPVYVGRLGLTDQDGARLVIDWRSPAAEPFFGATLADPMGLASRRRYRWTGGAVTDYWDEVFATDADVAGAALDDQSAFIASLGSSRSPRMRDVLGTIQADQDAVIRAGSDGALVVDGGPGTGKTVVALHRAAYLLYSDRRIAAGSGGVLVVGPHPAYLAYVEDVLPNLGEEGVQVCTLDDLVAEGSTANEEGDATARRLKASLALVDAIEAAVRHYETAPTAPMLVETPWSDLELGAAEWAEAFDSVERGAPHNQARDQVWETLLDILADQIDADEAPPHLVRRALVQNGALARAFATAWPLLDPAGVVGDLWTVPAYLRQCAPSLTEDEVRALQRPSAQAWTVSDLPLLDAARQRIGDPEASRRARRRAAALAAEQEVRDRVVEELVASDDSEMGVMSILRGADARNSLRDEDALPRADPDLLAGPFAHVVVDEAQELSDAEWRMLLRRCPTRSFTVVGDRAQARHGFTETWRHRLERVGLGAPRRASLTVNYRTPEEVMAEAEPVIRAAIPDANVPVSIRSTGVPVRYAGTGDRDVILDSWLADNDDGIACVIGDPDFEPRPRVRSLSAARSKGLEFDLVVLSRPDAFGGGIEGAVDRYVAMTRATGRLVVLTDRRIDR